MHQGLRCRLDSCLPERHHPNVCYKCMAQVEGNNVRHRPDTIVSFKPLVMSAEGLIANETMKEIKEWKLGRWDECNMLVAISKSLLLLQTREMGSCLLQLDYLPGYGPRDDMNTIPVDCSTQGLQTRSVRFRNAAVVDDRDVETTLQSTSLTSHLLLPVDTDRTGDGS